MSASAVSSVALRVHGLVKRFGTHTVLDGIDLSVGPGEVVGLIGPSGCGKSTLLRCIQGLETPEAGTVETNVTHSQGKAVASSIGMVFQRFHLFPHLQVWENVALAPRVVGQRSRSEARSMATQWLERVHMDAFAAVYPASLSGGQQQRVAIARALAMQPDMLLCDEPTSALDPELVGEVLDVLHALASEGRTMLIATHEMGFCRRVADRVCFLDRGRIVEEGPPDRLLENPQEPRTREFLSRLMR